MEGSPCNSNAKAGSHENENAAAATNKGKEAFDSKVVINVSILSGKVIVVCLREAALLGAIDFRVPALLQAHTKRNRIPLVLGPCKSPHFEKTISKRGSITLFSLTYY